ncbi:hypothetical protein HBA54_19310 [Pelagibius litoralis]|uniref:Uncharacterized protein n=1 Tax=Pelagibius litoralis TaxID=374515 RepID=A0A967KAZ0_9PROT|nr:hypothetical protein [Pelagibius litoralis]NIA70752.1 hypothetical protein [Pelagibius litoralis]
MASDRTDDYVLGRLVLDYIRAFMWPLVAMVVVLVYQSDVRTLIFEREIDVFGVRIGAKVEQIESQTLAEIADVRVLLEAQQAGVDGDEASPQIAEDIDAKLSSLERNLTREIAEVQSAQQARRTAPPQNVNPATAPPPAADNRSTRAAAAERRGFEALIDHDLTAALKAFDEARSIWPDYHNVAEIGQALRKFQSRLSDPESPMWPQLYREILTRYSWGLPEDLRAAIRKGAKKAY